MRKWLLPVFCISFALAIMILAVFAAAFGKGLYLDNFEDENVYEQLPDANERLGNLLGYLSFSNELNTEYYNEREAMHLKDVRNLLAVSAAIFLACAVFLAWFAAAFLKRGKLPGKALIYAGASGIGITIVLALLAINFDSFFIAFHELLFTNDLWLLNPETDKLIVMLPLSFFKKAAAKVFIISIALSITAIAFGFALKRRNAKTKSNERG